MRQKTDSGLVAEPRNGDAPLFEREGKVFFTSDSPDQLIQSFDSRGNHRSRNDIAVLRNSISSYLFEYVEEFRIATHFVGKISGTEMSVKKTDPIPIAVKVLNVDDGTLLSRFGLKGSLEFPVIEHFSSPGNAWVNDYHVYALGLATPEEFKQINRLAAKVNAVIRGLCDRRKLSLADIRLHFGRFKGQVLLCDELSPFTCTFIDMKNPAERGKYGPESKDAANALAELCDRLMLKA